MQEPLLAARVRGPVEGGAALGQNRVKPGLVLLGLGQELGEDGIPPWVGGQGRGGQEAEEGDHDGDHVRWLHVCLYSSGTVMAWSS